MKIYIMTDMEGVAGVINFDDYAFPEGRYYEVGRELTTLETSAAVQGAFDGGATEVLVVDGHGHGAINPALLHPQAKLLAGRPLGYPFGIDDSFDAAMIVGQHAKSNTDGGHLCHTGSLNVEDFTINGLSVGEMGCNMLFAAYYGVPTVLVSGDLAATEEARALVSNIETAAVKEGIKRGSATGLTEEENKIFNGAAIHLHSERAREVIREVARRAVKRAGEIQPFWLEPPYELISTLRPTKDQPSRTGRVTGDDLIEVLSAPKEYQ